MVTSSRQFKTILFECLTKINNSEDYTSLNYNIDDMNFILSEADKFGFLSGVFSEQSASGKWHIKFNNARLTLAGLEFIEAFNY